MKTQFPTDKIALRGQNILFLALPKHDAYYNSTPLQIATQLATQNKVIFVDHPFTFIDLLKGFYKKGIRKRLRAFWSAISCKKNGVDVLLTPFIWPINFLPKGKLYEFFLNWNHRILAKRVNTFLRKNEIDSVIYINSFNFYFPVLHQHLRTMISLNVYHCIDPMVKQFTLKHGNYLQERAAKEADIIISTAPELQKNFITNGYSKSYLVPNAANFNHFFPASMDIQVHPTVLPIQGKVMGYLGNIERRTDFELLKRVLDLLPDWQLILAGPRDEQYVPADLLNHKQVHFTGPVSYQDAPALMKRFDVAIIPFKRDEVSKGIYPLKLFEYMAAGKAVVSTNFNPDILAELNEVVHAAETPEQFADFVLLAYATDTDQKREKRIQVAAKNTWEQRAQLFSYYIMQELSTKHQQPYVA